MMVWLVYPLTTIVPNYSAFRKRNRRLFNRELLRQARRRLATSSILAIVWPHVYATQALTADQPGRRPSALHLHNRILTATTMVLGISRHLLRSTARCG